MYGLKAKSRGGNSPSKFLPIGNGEKWGLGIFFPMGNHGDSVMLKRLFFIKISIKYGDMDSSVSRDYFQTMLEGIF